MSEYKNELKNNRIAKTKAKTTSISINFQDKRKVKNEKNDLKIN